MTLALLFGSLLDPEPVENITYTFDALDQDVTLNWTDRIAYQECSLQHAVVANGRETVISGNSMKIRWTWKDLDILVYVVGENGTRSEPFAGRLTQNDFYPPVTNINHQLLDDTDEVLLTWDPPVTSLLVSAYRVRWDGLPAVKTVNTNYTGGFERCNAVNVTVEVQYERHTYSNPAFYGFAIGMGKVWSPVLFRIRRIIDRLC